MEGLNFTFRSSGRAGQLGPAWKFRRVPDALPLLFHDIPHGALSLQGASVVRHSTLQGNATGGVNRKGHSSLAGRRILGVL